MRWLLKTFAWFVVICCWVLYGAVIIASVLHPRPISSDPVREFKQNLAQMGHDWGFSLIMISLVVIYVICWAYVREKPEK